MIRREEGGIRNFVLLFAGQTVSQLGTNMISFALIKMVKYSSFYLCSLVLGKELV